MNNKIKILLVEDDQNLGSISTDYLNAKGFDCTWETDGEAGYQKFLKDKFDLLIFDVMMPIKDGFSLAKDVRGIDKMTYASNPNLLDEFNHYPNFVFENKDINDIEFLYECDYIINTAAETHVGNSIVKSEDFLHSNVNGVHNLLELIRVLINALTKSI